MKKTKTKTSSKTEANKTQMKVNFFDGKTNDDDES